MRLAILGCGYVGGELCRQLVTSGHEVVGVDRCPKALSRTEAAGATAVAGDVTDPDTFASVPDVDAILFTASTAGGDAAAARATFVAGLETVIETFGDRSNPPARLVYTSSTGVYGDHNGEWVDESTPIAPQSAKTEVLATAETVVADTAAMAGVVARIAGIYGPGRWGLERYLDRPVTAGWKNHAHRTDVVGALSMLAVSGVADDEVVLVVDDEPVHRWTFADWLADRFGREPTPRVTVEERLAAGEYSDRTRRRLTTSKRCSNHTLRSLGYEFRYPTYREGFRPAIEAATG